MTTRVYLVRHGATELTAEDRFAGAIDVKLSDEGRDAGAAAGRRLAGRADQRGVRQSDGADDGDGRAHRRVARTAR